MLTENYVLNANIFVFMLIHTELPVFSNVSGLIHELPGGNKTDGNGNEVIEMGGLVGWSRV